MGDTFWLGLVNLLQRSADTWGAGCLGPASGTCGRKNLPVGTVPKGGRKLVACPVVLGMDSGVVFLQQLRMSRGWEEAMSHWIGTTTPADAGMVEFKECLRRLRDGAATDALMHARRALGVAPKNPFYLSYTGLLAAVAEKRFGDAETLCREAIGVKCNHAQLYLNLAEVYHQAGTDFGSDCHVRERIDFGGARFSDSPGAGADWDAEVAGAFVLASESSGEPDFGAVAAPVVGRSARGVTLGAGPG